MSSSNSSRSPSPSPQPSTLPTIEDAISSYASMTSLSSKPVPSPPPQSASKMPSFPASARPKIIPNLSCKTTENRSNPFDSREELTNYIYNNIQHLINQLTTWFEQLGCSRRNATYLTQFIIVNLLLLLPLILSALLFTACLLLFSVSFILSAVFTSLAVVIVIITTCLFALLIVIALVTATVLGITAFMALVLSAIVLLAAPILASAGMLNHIDLSYFKLSTSTVSKSD